MIMKGIIYNWRYWVLGLLSIAAFILLVGEPTVYGQDWVAQFAAVKLSGAALSAAVIGLYRFWSARGEMGDLHNYVNGNND